MSEYMEDRVGALEDLEAIRRLRHEWCARLDIALESADAVEAGEAVAWLVDQLTDDFTQTSNIHDPVSSPQGFAAFVQAIAGNCEMSFHMLSNDLIEFPPGRHSASGGWYTMAMLTIQGRALWASCLSEEKYRKRGGRWYVTALSLDYRLVSPYEAGWAEQRFVEKKLCELAY